MTVESATARTRPAPRMRPLPWRRMAWITWRQHRLTLAAVAGLFAAAGVYLLITGLQMHDAFAAVAACHPATAQICQQVAGNFLDTYAPGIGWALGSMQVIPALVGAFVGAPVLARELETGTYRYAWTQGFGRSRWTVAKLVPLAAAVTIAAAAFTALVAWYVQPVFDAGDSNGPLYPTLFDLLGVALAAWTLTAFAIGVLAGFLIRRVVPAILATLAVWIGLAVATGLFFREHYIAPVVTTSASIPAQAWVIAQGWFQNGKPATLDMINHTLAQVDVRALTPELFEPGTATPPSLGDPVRYLIQHGYAQITTYQPAGRFWEFQWIEGGWLLVLSVLLIAAAVWLVRRRAA